MILAVTPQRTADNRFTAPTPMTVVVMVCVVLTGRPKSGKWMNITFASHPACRLPGDHMQPQPYYQQDIATPLPTLNPDSTITVPKTGMGCEIDWAAVEKMTVGKWIVKMR